MVKKVFFYIDDVIWVFRDLTRQRPASLFDNPFLHVLRTAHERYDLKVQLNVFYRTDFFYGDDEFTLAEMTNAYKAEWEAASDWLKLGFHAKQEFPDYPYVNATYETVKNNLDAIYGEIVRFAGKGSFALGAVPHWAPISREGCRALHDGGIRLLYCTGGERHPYSGDPSSLPYGHAGRLLQNRQPETALFRRVTLDTAIASSICAYNHLTSEQLALTEHTLGSYPDEATGIRFKSLRGPCLNLMKRENLEAEITPSPESEFMAYATHEQYFYPDYYGYQPDYADKIYLAAEILRKNGYEYIFAEDLV